ncbi:anaerobic carbon-monoxide dehydrogenase catalytic subunit [Blautia coccoides]|nr:MULTISPECIES: anaerobic carbon-monoxide dehydrogenase catalytic subunit [Blautia]MCQ4741631.1 anaerobic carbon-monoxide dehydrogenase catalytic subunit [Blautia producta]MCR1984834.1 anaerobic carbon-monoxide dehydrogenase catalytic subunit [Blautia coccoides]MDU5218171.1 anaerobic carbon-monoxide dehydrogenase catalytic subunit [Blautia producta]MDU5382786.1 anaerobic carbon-monoxide dehydrogenase catalytic subunit [Blautia producta]MDU6881107.1 anaerobic carbon-monoxide dehydrogenase cata
MDGFHDYTEAVNAYRKTFSNKEKVLEQTPDPAVREMLLHMQEMGVETVFDRFDRQQPQCSFGIAGVCCKNCYMGPCRITKKCPRGVCGADADVIVARNLLRALAAGAAAHGARGRESMLALKKAGEGTLDLPIEGEQKIRAVSEIYGLQTQGKTIRELAVEVADILLEDLSRTVPDPHRTLAAFAPKERQEVWAALDILPISVYHEVFESLHRTSTGTDGDWRNLMKQFLRTGVAFAWTSCLGSSIAMDSLYGLPQRGRSKMNLGALKKGFVNIAVHGHSPLLVSEIVRTGQSEKYQKKAKEAGAEGIQFYGICCSGLSAMYRYGGVIPLSNAVGSELVLGTGALDLWVADVQDVFPSIMDVAKCFKTTVVTTSDSARLPGAEHYAFDHHHSNLNEIHDLAVKIVERGIESFQDRREVPVFIPKYEVEAETGFSAEFAAEHFGGLEAIADAMREGKILGIVNLVGCSNPRLVYEKAVAETAEILLKNNILIMTNGCASFPLMKLGYCSVKALEQTGEKLRGFLGDVPPVWQMGECLDNARASALFAGVAAKSGHAIKELPYAFISPEWSNEKGLCAALAFRLLGMNSYHSVYAPTQGSEKVTEFMAYGTKELLGSEMVVDVDHIALAERIVRDLKEKRRTLGWVQP